jgi:hypothetical protein
MRLPPFIPLQVTLRFVPHRPLMKREFHTLETRKNS